MITRVLRLPEGTFLAIGHATLDLGIVQMTPFTSRSRSSSFTGTHTLEGNRMTILVTVLALQCHLDLLKLLAFARQRRVRTDLVKQSEACLGGVWAVGR